MDESFVTQSGAVKMDLPICAPGYKPRGLVVDCLASSSAARVVHQPPSLNHDLPLANRKSLYSGVRQLVAKPVRERSTLNGKSEEFVNRRQHANGSSVMRPAANRNPACDSHVLAASE